MDRPSNLPESDHFPSTDLNLLKVEYEYLYSICRIREDKIAEVEKICKKIIESKSKYQKVEKAIGVPWYFVATVHMREASLNFNTYLGNGDPLNKKTNHVPKGRGPFKTWEDGAIDALRYEGYDNLLDWSLGITFKRLEGFNGWGYRTGKMQETTPRNASPYTYSYTQFYVKGRSIEDHSWYPNSIDDNPGCMVILKQLEAMGEKLFDFEYISNNKDKKAIALNLADQIGQRNQLQKLFDSAKNSKANYWAIVDFNKSSSEERLYIFNLEGESCRKFLVAHGVNSGEGYATHFSNEIGSLCSSIGICKTLGTYVGQHGESLRLNGLEATNSNELERQIVIHSANYVVSDYNGTGRAGRSEGCFAVNPNYIDEVIDCLRDGSYMLAWHSNPQ